MTTVQNSLLTTYVAPSILIDQLYKSTDKNKADEEVF